MRENIREKLRDDKITNVSPTTCSCVSNLVPIKCLDIVSLP